jgi:hypothetical protein
MKYSGQLSARVGFWSFQTFSIGAGVAAQLAWGSAPAIVIWCALHAMYWGTYSVCKEFERDASPTGEKEQG